MPALPKYVGALDQGTSSTRFMLFDEAGAVASRAQAEHTQLYPRPGWVEHDPLEIWQRTLEVISRALGGISPEQVCAIGITNQRETTVVWDKRTGKPLYNAIVWNCTRTDELAHRTAARFQDGKDHLRAQTGLPIVPYFSATKLVWLFENVPGLFEAALAGDAIFGTIDTWLIWKLTGGREHVTDVSNGSRTLLMNIHTLQWDPEGSIVPGLANVPITGILGDQQAATFGQVCFSPGQAKATFGTGAFIMMNTGIKAVASKNGLLTTVGWQLGEGEKLNECECECELSVDDNGGVYVVPAFAGLFAPYWRSDARGVICGLTAFNTSAHLVRACVEASAYQVKDILDAMASDSNVRLHTLRCDGGMTANAFLMQFQADMVDVDVAVPSVSETTALGAAFAASLAVGFFKDLDSLSSQWKKAREWKPHMGSAQREYYARHWAMAVDRSLDWHVTEPSPFEAVRMKHVRSGSSGKDLEHMEKPQSTASSAITMRVAVVVALAAVAFLSGRRSVSSR
ncbi:glycerol kinase [Pavlovales sp. CCMP2436]|nr:glycerol kinase [Pavlovales sp. CCMP2436]